MPSLAQILVMTHPVSSLRRKARRLGIKNVDQMLALAEIRGCRHYSQPIQAHLMPEHFSDLSDAELTILLLLGENPYNPTAIRCAAQLARSPHVNVASLARLGIMEKCERVLAHIARAGIAHDQSGAAFWQQLLDFLPATAPRAEPHLPHWSRFVSMPGVQRQGVAAVQWLVPQR